MTKKNLAAHRRNARLSQGPVTPEGRERSRSGPLRHGFHSQAEEVALRALGEDPDEFLEVLQALRGSWLASDGAQDRLVRCLARAVWRIDRADRIREGHNLRLAKEANDGRERRLHAQIMRMKMTADSLRLLAQSVARRHYVATIDDLKQIKSLQQDGAIKEMGEIALALFFQLREPGTPGLGEPGECEDEEEKTRSVMAKIRTIFGLKPFSDEDEEEGDVRPEPQGQEFRLSDRDANAGDSAGTGTGGTIDSQVDASSAEPEEADPYPDISDDEWTQREPVRQLLENILTQEVQICEARHSAMLKELIAGPSPYERAAEITPTQPHATLMQRMEDANIRQASRLLDLLVKMKREDRERGVTLKTVHPKNDETAGPYAAGTDLPVSATALVSGDINDNKGS
jgi:hypothetical protein